MHVVPISQLTIHTLRLRHLTPSLVVAQPSSQPPFRRHAVQSLRSRIVVVIEVSTVKIASTHTRPDAVLDNVLALYPSYAPTYPSHSIQLLMYAQKYRTTALAAVHLMSVMVCASAISRSRFEGWGGAVGA